MGTDFNPNLNIDNPLAEIIEAENTLREFGAASAGMEFLADQDEAATSAIGQAEEAQQLTNHEQELHKRIAELEAQLATQRGITAAKDTGAKSATITATAVEDNCPEIVDAETVIEDSTIDDGAADTDTEAFEEAGPDDATPDDDSLARSTTSKPPDAVGADDSGLPDNQTDAAESDVIDWDALAEYQSQEAKAAKIPMVTLEHRIPRAATKNIWDTSSPEDIIRVKVPKATVFPNPAQPYTVSQDAIVLPDGITGSYQIASTRPMLSENTVYVTWRINDPTRTSSLFF